MNTEEQFLTSLKEDRRRLVGTLENSPRYDETDFRKLVLLQGAIAAIEAVITEKRDESAVQDEPLPAEWFSEEDTWSRYQNREAIEQAISSLVHQVVKGMDMKLLELDQTSTTEQILGRVTDELDWLVTTTVARKIIAAEFGIDLDLPGGCQGRGSLAELSRQRQQAERAQEGCHDPEGHADGPCQRRLLSGSGASHCQSPVAAAIKPA